MNRGRDGQRHILGAPGTEPSTRLTFVDVVDMVSVPIVIVVLIGVIAILM